MSTSHVIYAVNGIDNTLLMRAPYQIYKVLRTAGIYMVFTGVRNDSVDELTQHDIQLELHRSKWKLFTKLLFRKPTIIAISWIWYLHCLPLLISKILGKSPYVIVLDSFSYFNSLLVKNWLHGVIHSLRFGLILKYADLVLAESVDCYTAARKINNNVLLVSPGLFLADVNEIENNWQKQDKSHDREKVILWVGRFSKEKCVEHLLLAFSRLVNEFDDWVVELRGIQDNTTYEAELHSLVGKLGLESKVRFLEPIYSTDLYLRHHQTAIFCLPSRIEGFPTSIIQAMCFGGAIVASYCGEIDYQLGGQECGLSYVCGDIDTLTSYLQIAMSDQFLRDEMISRARKRFVELFVWEKYQEDIIAEFQRIITARNGHQASSGAMV